MRDFAGVILAAGSSSRMGSPKQLLPAGRQTLLERAILIMVAAGFEDISVVIGANSDEVSPLLANKNVKVVLNEQWEEGIGSSICAAVKAVMHEDTEGISRGAVFALADQPNVQPEHLLALSYSVFSGCKVAASEYDKTLGVPCAFSREMFPELLKLEGAQGAKFLIQGFEGPMARIPLVEFADLDTPEDYDRWKNQELQKH